MLCQAKDWDLMINRIYLFNIGMTILTAIVVCSCVGGCSAKEIAQVQTTLETVHPAIDAALIAAPCGNITLYIMLAVDILSSVLAGAAAYSKRKKSAEIGEKNGND